MSILTRDERLACGPSVLPRPSSPLLSQLAVPPQLQIVVGQLTSFPVLHGESSKRLAQEPKRQETPTINPVDRRPTHRPSTKHY